MKGLIIYKSKYGATRQYAEWLGNELDIPVKPLEKATNEQIDSASFLIIGTPVYFGKLRMGNWIRKNANRITGDRKLFLFIVNASAPAEQEARDRLISENIPKELSQRCEIYFLPGRIIHKDLSWRDKLVLKITGSLIKDPVKKQAMQNDLDEVKRENLRPVVKAVMSFRSLVSHPSLPH